MTCATIDLLDNALPSATTHLATFALTADSEGTAALGFTDATSLVIVVGELQCGVDIACTTATINVEASSVIDTDEDGVLDNDDNCALVANPLQTNSDSGPPPPAGDVGVLDNGPGVLGDDTTVPNGDELGNVCDDDNDNDGLPDAEDTEPLGGTGVCAPLEGSSDSHAAPAGGDVAYSDATPPSWDTDGDAVPDGRECIVGTNPRIASGAHRTACAATVPATPADTDADGLLDAWEACGWGTSASSTNSDGDAIGDCREAMDVNGSGTANNNDAVFVKQHFFGIIVGDPAAMDINRSATLNNNDAVFIQQAFFGVNPCL
jgi:hypothetical protein